MYTVVPKFMVESLLFEQLLVAAVLHDLPVVDDVDLVHVLDGRQSVGDGDGGAPHLGSVQRVLYNLQYVGDNYRGIG